MKRSELSVAKPDIEIKASIDAYRLAENGDMLDGDHGYNKVIINIIPDGGEEIIIDLPYAGTTQDFAEAMKEMGTMILAAIARHKAEWNNRKQRH